MVMMPVVVGVDGSEESLRAVEWAAREAQRHGAPLRLVSAAAMPPRMRAHGGGTQTVADELYDKSVRALSEAVTRAEEVSSRLLIDASPLAGAPAVEVTASGSGALMLVVGARGMGGFAAMLLGSVSRYAAMHAPCPLVVVREETSAVHGEIVVGIRDSLDTDATLAFAFDEAVLRGAALIAVHSWNRLASGIWRPADAEEVTAEERKSLTDALAPWREKFPGVPVRCDVVHDHPGHVLASYTGRSELVIIGRHGSAAGGIQHALLSHAHGPVAVVPHRS